MSLSLKNNCILALSFCAFSSLSYADDCLHRSFDIKIKEQTSSSEIINQLSNICSFSVVYKDRLAKSILGNLQDGINVKGMHLFDVFDLLVKENGLDYTFDNNILRIKGQETRTFKIDYITSIREGSAVTKANVEIKKGDGDSDTSDDGGEDNMIKTSEKFDFWKDIGQEIKRIMQTDNAPSTEPIINQNAGLITVTSTPQALNRIANYLAKLEKSLKKQVVIDVSIIEVALNDSHQTGIDWSQFDLTFGAGWKYETGHERELPADQGDEGGSDGFTSSLSRSLNMEAELNIPVSDMVKFLQDSGDVRVVSSPKIATMNNQQALITVGDTINYKLQGGTSTSNAGSTTSGENAQSIFVGILLNILPEISDDNNIMLRINPSISKIKQDSASAGNYRGIAPDTTQKKLSTVVQARDGETIVLGGLISDSQGYTKKGVPILGDIPVLGKLFSTSGRIKKKSELVFIITPKVVDFNKPTNIKDSLKELGYEMSLDYDKPLKQKSTSSVFSSHSKEQVKKEK